ncbi:PWWP domain-containing DNA repair factor 3A-like isoform X1 [Osmerus eperlanus]|uniref:PWWP domain-containing DNA repair factor 3A-like isoform X1 n=2 Tax=Osmerus eperlanus TaxID=29151 RepID=UPI002E1364F4
MNMISSDDSPSCTILGRLRRTSRRCNALSSQHLALEANVQSKSPIPSKTLISPEKQRSVTEVTTNGHNLRKRILPDNRLQTCHACGDKSNTSCHSKPQKELNSHVSKQKNILPQPKSNPHCPSKVLKEPVTGPTKKGNGRKRKKLTFSDLSQCSNDLATGTLTDTLAKEHESKTRKRCIKTEKVSKGTKKQLPTSNLVGTQRKRQNTSRKSFVKNDSERSSHLHQFTRITDMPSLRGESNFSLPSTPRRCRKQPCQFPRPCLSSTPDRSMSTINPLPVPLSSVEFCRTFQDSLPISEWKESDTAPLEKASELPVIPPRRGRGRPRKNRIAVKPQGNEKWTKAQPCFSVECPPAKRRCRKGPKTRGDDENATNSQSYQRCRPRLEPLSEAKSPDQVRLNPDETTLSSDLSIELSLQEDHLTSLSLLEEHEEEEDEEELPSFLIQIDKQPPSITEGICVWCKFRNYPFWPAMVKRVNRKLKKASIVFIDDQLLDKKRIRKGFSVALKTLKPFDCEEADQLMEKAKEKYEGAITWCRELITDYRIRIGCGSFTGSFIEYFADDISCPVRKMYPQGTSALTFPSKLIMEEDYVVLDDHEDESSSEQQEEQGAKKLLPDRSKAARNRANDKLVHFIIKQRRVEKRLLAVISGQQQSKWLRSFLRASRTVVDTYLEDEEQLDQVYLYLKGVYDQAPCIARCLADADRIRFVLDVLLPEAIIYAIAGVDKVSLERAEDKYLKGPCLSKREREEFDLMIEQQMKPLRKGPA